MHPQGENLWKLAGTLDPGQGIRWLEIDGQAMLLIQRGDEPLIIDASCCHCGQGLGSAGLSDSTITCGNCGSRQPLPAPGSAQCYPLMVVEDEIYMIPELPPDEKL